MKFRNTCLYGVSPAILALAVAAGSPALAADAASTATSASTAQATGLAEVIVTAQKVAQRLQDVPVAVTAYNPEELKRQHILSIADLAGITPGLTIQNSAPNGVNILFFSMRGQYQSSTLATTDPSIGVYVDGLYIARAYGINTQMLDMSSAQVLRGPQGTLFGRNTTGGAIVLTSNNPDLSTFSGNVSAGYGRFNYRTGTAVINAPIIEDRLGVRAAFTTTGDDGYVTNSGFNGYKDGNINQYEGRIKILGKVTDTLSVLLSADFYNDNYAPDNGQIRYVGQGTIYGASNLEAGAELLGGAGACFANIGNCFATGSAAFASEIAAANAHPDQVNYTINPYTRTSTQTYGITIADQTPIGEAKLIAGYRRVKESNDGDYDGSPITIANFSTFEALKQYSIEAQLTGKTLNNRLSYAGGVFYFDESGDDKTLFLPLPELTGGGLVVYDGYINNKSVGVYGQGTYEITDKLSITGGIRWSYDDKSVAVANGSAAGTTNGETPGSFVCGVAAGCPSTVRGTFSGISYTGALDYKLTPDLMLYGKVASSFRSGGVNLRITFAVPDVPTSFQPERITSFEGGFKSEFLDHRVRFNVAGYYMIANDFQIESIVPNPADVAVNTTFDLNASRADFYGGEAELAAKVIDAGPDTVTLTANAAHVVPKYVNYHDFITGYDRSQESFAFVPRWQFTITGNYSHRYDFGTASLFASYDWDSGYETSNFNYFVDSGGAYHYASDGSVITQQDALGFYNAMHKNAGGIMNLRASLRFGEGERYEVAAYGTNVLNNREFINSNAVLSLDVSALREHPATWGVEFSAKF